MNSNNLPRGWVWTTIGDISDLIHYGYTASSTDMPTGTKMLRITDIQNNFVNWDTVPFCEIEPKAKEKCLLRDGDLVFARTGATVGKSFLIRGKIPEAVFASYLIRIILSDHIDKDYVYDFFQSHAYWLQINEGQIGTGQPNVNSQILSKIVLPLPPLPEQRFIVAKVESLLDHVKKAKESLDKIPLIMKRFRQAALKKAFSGELTAEWRAQQQDLEPATELLRRIRKEQECDYQTNVRQKKAKNLKKQEIELFDASELPELPDEWVWCNLREITQQTSTKYPRRAKDGSFYYVDIEAIDNAKQTINVPRKIENANAPSRAKRIIKTGDVIFSLVRPYLKNIALIPTELDGQIASTAFYVLRPAKSLHPRFLFNGVRRQSFIDSIKTYGDSPPSARDEEFSLLPFPLPPLPEQQEIVRRIEVLFKFADGTEKNAAEARKRVEIMTQSILARAFRGDLSADFREAVRNWKDLDAEARGRYVFVLPEGEREKVLEANEFPMEAAGELLLRIRDEREKIEDSGKKLKGRGKAGVNH